MTKIIEEVIHTTVNGIIYKGKRILKGIRAQYQTIFYEGLSKKDNLKIIKGREEHALFNAKQILSELVKEYHGFPRHGLSE